MKFTPTQEQEQIISAAQTGVNLAIKAGAGASKTTTCRLIAENVKKKTLYVAFTVANKKEAEESFAHLRHVEVNNWHSMAWNAIVKGTPWSKGRGKDSMCVGYWDIRGDISKIIGDETIDAWKVTSILQDFCKSSSTSLADTLVPFFENGELNQEFERWLDVCNTVWAALSNSKNGHKINHDIYLKMYQLSKPNLSARYEVLILDEGQDTNPVCMGIFLEQERYGVQLIIVGDEAQAIYGWRGAVNAFAYIPKEGFNDPGVKNITNTQEYPKVNPWKYLTLSESFRFGPKIAEQANIVLSAMNSDMRLKGRGTKTKIETKSTLVRNNSTLFGILLAAADSGQKVEVIADLKDLYIKLWTAFYIRNSSKKEKTEYGMFPDMYLKGFKNWKELCDSSDPEARKIVNILSACDRVRWFEAGKELTGLKAAIAKANSAIWDGKGNSDFVLCTGHKAKGLEWDEVTLTNDFLPLFNDREDKKEVFEKFKENQGLELFYVALTRARVKLNITWEIEEFLDLLFSGELE